MANIDELSRYITDEMRRNVHSADAKQIAALKQHHSTYGMALWKWAGLVGYAKKWDHKDLILKRFGPWSFDPITKYEYFSDIWSNIHYGYIGLSTGFSEGILKSGAGVAQLKKSGVVETFSAECKMAALEFACFPALDHPQDQAAVQAGFDLWKTKGLQITVADVTNMVQSRRAILNAKRRKS